MVDDLAIQLALRARLVATLVLETTTDTMSATAGGFTRLTGSFVADGLAVGMEVTPVGFASIAPATLTFVSPLSVTVREARTPEAASPGRALRVGLPALRAWDNAPFNPVDGRWYVEEDYLPGAPYRVTVGEIGEFDVEPHYVVRLYGVWGNGIGALSPVANAVINQFAPNLKLQASDGHVIRVLSDPGPYRSQVRRTETGHAVVVITIPLWVRTTNEV